MTIKTPVRYDDDLLQILDADNESIADLDNWLDEIDMDGQRMGDYIALCINERDELLRKVAELEAWVKRGTAFQLIEDNYVDQNSPRPVAIERRRQINGADKWVVKMHEWVLDKFGEWQYEPMPSSRTDEFLEATRYESKDFALSAFDASQAAQKAAEGEAPQKEKV